MSTFFLHARLPFLLPCACCAGAPRVLAFAFPAATVRLDVDNPFDDFIDDTFVDEGMLENNE